MKQHILSYWVLTMNIITTLDKKNFITKNTNNIVSTIYLEIDEKVFPDIEWTDFSIVILHWWNEEFIKQVSGKEKGRYEFMDGPFYFELTSNSSDVYSLSIFEEKAYHVDEIFKTNISKHNFFSTLLKASDKILTTCKEVRYENNDVLSLKKSFEKIQSLN